MFEFLPADASESERVALISAYASIAVAILIGVMKWLRPSESLPASSTPGVSADPPMLRNDHIEIVRDLAEQVGRYRQESHECERKFEECEGHRRDQDRQIEKQDRRIEQQDHRIALLELNLKGISPNES